MTEATTTTPAAIAAAAESLGRDMLDALMTQIEKMPGWSMASASTRELALREFKQAVENTIQTAIQVIGTGQFPACAATLANVSFGADIRATLKIDRNAPGRHDLVDMAGLPVVILMASPDDYLARMQDVKLRSSQGDLFGAPAGTDPDEFADDDAPDAPGGVIGETNGEIRQSLSDSASKVYRDAQAGRISTDTGDAAAVPGSDSQPSESADAQHPTDDHIGQFLRSMLDQLDILVADDFVTGLTPEQRRLAWTWSERKQQYPHTRSPRPAFLPLPTDRGASASE